MADSAENPDSGTQAWPSWIMKKAQDMWATLSCRSGSSEVMISAALWYSSDCGAKVTSISACALGWPRLFRISGRGGTEVTVKSPGVITPFFNSTLVMWQVS
jgi:hypothetical protein